MKPSMRTVGCFLEYQGKFLLLYRHSHKPDGNTWALPAGKVEPNESDEQAIIRELDEETGYKAKPEEFEFLGNEVFEFEDLHLEFPIFKLRLKEPIETKLERAAHAEHTWVAPEEAYAMPNLIRGLHDLLKRVGYIQDEDHGHKTTT